MERNKWIAGAVGWSDTVAEFAAVVRYPGIAYLGRM
jgi:hypothetical protein